MKRGLAWCSAVVGLAAGCGGLAFDGDGSEVTTVAEAQPPASGAGARRGSGARTRDQPSEVESRESGNGSPRSDDAPTTCDDDARCLGAVLQQCVPSQGWVSRRRCTSSAACDASAGACREVEPLSPSEPVDSADSVPASACESGDLRCIGPTLQICLEDSSGWLSLQVCASDALCSADEGGPAGCGTPACGFDEWRCDGATLQRCRDDRTDFENLSVCVSDGICRRSLASGRERCLECSCQVGDMRCAGAVLQRCDDECRFRTVDDCGAPELCDPSQVRCLPSPIGDAGAP